MLGMNFGRQRKYRWENLAGALYLQGTPVARKFGNQLILMRMVFDNGCFESGQPHFFKLVSLMLNLRVKGKQGKGRFPAGDESRLFVNGIAVDRRVKSEFLAKVLEVFFCTFAKFPQFIRIANLIFELAVFGKNRVRK